MIPLVQNNRSLVLAGLFVGQNLERCQYLQSRSVLEIPEEEFTGFLWILNGHLSRVSDIRRKRELTPEMGIRPDHEGPASKLTEDASRVNFGVETWWAEYKPSGIFVPSTKNFSAAGLENVTVDSCRLVADEGWVIGPRKSCKRSSCSR